MDDLDIDSAMADIHKAANDERDQTARDNFNAFSTGLKAPIAPTNPQEVAASVRHPDTGGALRIDHWVADLPKNVSVGLIDAAVNSADTIRSVSHAFYHSHTAEVFGQPMAPDEPKPPPALTADEKKNWESQHLTGDAAYTHVRGSVMAFRDRLANGLENPEDTLTQGVAQLAIPGLGLAKLTGATASFGLLNTAHVAAADAAAAGVVLDPHSGRLADLAVLAKHTEGKIGAVFNTLAPDGSLMNHYLNWMHDRVGESDWGGRLKNMVDSLSGSAALAGVVNGAIGSIRLSRYMAETAGTAPMGLKAQLGMVAFHGTPHTFDTFDAAKIGSGEGAQSYGHGLYFAENKNTATHYQQKLTGTQNQAFVAAKSEVGDASGDKAKAVTVLNSKMANEVTPVMRDFYKRAIDYVKSGATDRGKGMLAHAEIPDAVVGAMLNHDLLMRDQPEVLAKIPQPDQRALGDMLFEYNLNTSGDMREFTGNEFRQMIERGLDEGYIKGPVTGKGTAADASAYLDAHGIPGIKYFDARSRKAPSGFFGSPSHGTGEGTRNIVLFDPKHAKIIKKE